MWVAAHSKGRKRKAVALLHDTIEDSPLTIADLSKVFDSEIVEAVKAITKKAKEPYAEYLKRVKNNDIAKDVKIVDLKHNSNLKRLPKVTKRDIARVEKYKNAIAFLKTVQF